MLHQEKEKAIALQSFLEKDASDRVLRLLCVAVAVPHGPAGG
jgi:hypothetical protein